MAGKPKPPDWTDLSDRLYAMSEELFAVAEFAPDEMETQLVELQAITVRHYGHLIRDFADREENPILGKRHGD
jgi:hypothetical protein